MSFPSFTRIAPTILNKHTHAPTTHSNKNEHYFLSDILLTNPLLSGIFVYPLLCLSSFAASFLTPTKYPSSPIHDNNYHDRHHHHASSPYYSSPHSHSSSCNIRHILQNNKGQQEDIYSVVHRKRYEMKRLNAKHATLFDPIRMAMGYAQEGIERKRPADALHRVYDDPFNSANPNQKQKKLLENGMAKSTMRRDSFVVDV
mmetsp:Transcript_15457/g.28098  ORF Transcript_15457/g.28098 Transcript_15457/m.28098 type:complete len:201 (+) Transcript_15457:115-717(+)